MLAMQYRLTLPGDYDMTIVDRRISEKGHLIDDFPNLKWKAYLSARRSKASSASENLYAPFYIWDKSEGLNDFICGPGFVGLTQSFGWPSVTVWSVWKCSISSKIKSAIFATREILATSRHCDLASLRQCESDDASADVEARGALASVSAFEPTTWSRVRFRLWGEEVPLVGDMEAYDVGYMSVTGMNAKK
jgi:Domain of unknown function (DUF4865)